MGNVVMTRSSSPGLFIRSCRLSNKTVTYNAVFVQFTLRPLEGRLKPFPWQPHAGCKQWLLCTSCGFLTMEKTYLGESALKAVDDYWEYTRIVGDDDGGKLFTPEQYEEYKRKVLPQRVKNRLYVSYGVPGGIDCKLIGPETQCFCAHRYKQHKTEWETVPCERPLALPCRVRGCRCPAYQYVPRLGPSPVRCRCKHLPQDHSEASGHLCKKCSSCSGYQSPYTCGCGQPSSAHQTLVETKPEREARGKPVGRDVPYAAMGGLTGFTSLLDGYLALEARDSASFSAQHRDDGCQQSNSALRIPGDNSVLCKREIHKH